MPRARRYLVVIARTDYYTYDVRAYTPDEAREAAMKRHEKGCDDEGDLDVYCGDPQVTDTQPVKP